MEKKVSPYITLLRLKAEEYLKKKKFKKTVNLTSSDGICSCNADHLKIIHELEVSQIELEMQNEELQLAVNKAATATAHYDFSPTGYFTIESDWTISEMNLNGARMLGKERSNLTKINFKQFISPDTLQVFNHFLKKAVETNSKQICEVNLVVNVNSTISVHLEGFFLVNEQKYLVTAINMTHQNQAGEAIRLNESRLRRAELASKTGNWELHIDSQKLYISDGAVKLFGVDRDQFEYADIKDITLLEYRSLLDLAKIKLINENKPYNVEFKIRTQDTGQIKDIHSIATYDKEKRILFGSIQDITERKLMEDRIQKSELYYRTMVETSPDAIVIVDATGQLQFVSQRACEIFLLPSDSLIGTSILQWIAPEMRESTLERIKNIHSGILEPEHNEYKMLKTDGSIILVEIIGSRLQNPAGQTEGLFLICRDITERKRAEKALQNAHDELKNLHDNLDEAIFSFDPVHNKMLQVSQAHEAIFGYPPSEFFKNPQLWYNLIIPEDKQIIDLGFPTLVSGEKLQNEFRIIHPDGQLRWIATRMRPTIDKGGKLVHIDGIAYDITQRKQAEEANRETEKKFQMVFENVFDGIAIYVEDPDPFKRKLTECNEQYAHMAGRSREELFKLGYTQELQITREASANTNRLQSLSLNKAYQGSYSWIRPDGKDNIIEYIGVPIMWRGKSYSIGIDRDITERKHAEVELIAAKEKAEESDRLKSTFLANMSHEVRTPLNSIIGFSQLLAEPDFEEEQKDEFIQHIIKNGNNLLTIISDIMDISKLESGEIIFNKTQINAQKFISRIKEQFSFQAEANKLEFKLTLSETEKETVIFSDLERLSQIFSNLVSNALKFTPNGQIEIGYHSYDTIIEFYVRDTGIGIPIEYHDKIFERFIQVEGESTRKYGGNGLGLAITKNLVELMGGKIWLESEFGKGSVFYFTMPINC